MKKSNELQKANAKLQSELQQKENLISAQGIHYTLVPFKYIYMYYCFVGVEGSQWRDKVRNAETEVEKFKTAIADKTKKLQDLQKQVATYTLDISLKETKLNEALELIKKVLYLFLSFVPIKYLYICLPNCSCRWNLLECTILPYFQVSRVIILVKSLRHCPSLYLVMQTAMYVM